MVPKADHPTRTLTLTLTLTLWRDLCLDAVACEGSRLIRPKGDAVDGGCVIQNSRTRVCIQHFRGSAVTVHVVDMIPCLCAYTCDVFRYKMCPYQVRMSLLVAMRSNL